MNLKSNFTSAKMEANTNKNRYTDILALEGTRVHLPNTPYCSTDYINANFVNTEMSSFICTQSPLVKTSFDFWLMVWNQKSTVIVALNRLIENKTIKGNRYWPDKERKLKFENLTVKLLSTIPLPELHVIIRRLKLYYNNTEREIYHLHYEGWPDYGVPQNTVEIRELVRIALFYQKLADSNTKEPMVVHCSAGIGRSGSFMVIVSIMSDPIFNRIIHEEAYSKSEKGKLFGILSQFRIPDMVLSFRQKRHPGIVQTPQQYDFIYTALLDEICNPSTVSKSLKKVIQCHSVKIYEKEFLSKSGPYFKRKFYPQFLSDNTSNDLKYIFRDQDIDGESSQDDRSFLVSSTPLIRFVDNFTRLVH